MNLLITRIWASLGVLTIYTNHTVLRLVHKNETIKFDVVRERPPCNVYKSAEQMKKSGKIESPGPLKSDQAHVFSGTANGIVSHAGIFRECR